MPTNRAKKCPPTGHRRNGHQQSTENRSPSEQGPSSSAKTSRAVFFAANLGSCFKNQSLTFNPDFSWAKTSFMALRCTSVPPAQSGSRLIVQQQLVVFVRSGRHSGYLRFILKVGCIHDLYCSNICILNITLFRLCIFADRLITELVFLQLCVHTSLFFYLINWHT